MTDKADQESI